jgi:hypothetical protein
VEQLYVFPTNDETVQKLTTVKKTETEDNMYSIHDYTVGITESLRTSISEELPWYCKRNKVLTASEQHVNRFCAPENVVHKPLKAP